jgi:hypothetical protein
MNIMIAVVHKHAQALADTTEHTSLAHVATLAQ